MKTPKRRTTTPKPTPKRASSKGIKDLVDRIAPAIEALKKAQDQARAAGLFPHDRELLWCPRCGLEESVSAHGMLYPWVAPNYRVDTGHRFIEPKGKDDPFIWPKCGNPAREDDWERRLSEDHPEPAWESVKTRVPMAKVDAARVSLLCQALRTSDRVKRSVKKLGEAAMLERYGLVDGEVLTNLGVLLVGARRERLRLGGVRAAQYDKTERVVRDLALADAPLWEVPNVIRREIEALDEYEEVFTPVGVRNVPAFDPRVVRELVVNALVHRSYVRRGDIEVRLYGDRLEVESPGVLPPTVSRITLLRAQRARNERLARLFVDLGWMERKGTGGDVVFDQLAAGRAAPRGHAWLEATGHAGPKEPVELRNHWQSLGFLAGLPSAPRDRIFYTVEELRSESMTAAAQPELKPGQTYRTRDLVRWGRNPARLARRLVREGRLREVTHGLYYTPVPSKFGAAPVSDEVLLRAFLDGEPFLISGPPRWNPLGLGATAMFASTLVYNTLRTGDFKLAGRTFVLRRVYFPEKPTPEWFVVDLLKHHDMAGVALSEVRTNLVDTLRLGRWDVELLREMAATYGTKAIASLIEECIAEARAT